METNDTLIDKSNSFENDLVLVTGASSFIGSHIIKLLLQQGYRVRGTVTSLEDEALVKPLKNLLTRTKHNLNLYQVDLLNESTFREPLKGVKYFIHTEAPYPEDEVDVDVDEENESDRIEVCLKETKAILNACIRYGKKTLRRFVFTSSLGAITGDSFENDKIYTESDWPSNFDDLQLHIKSKVVCEKYIWDFVRERLENEAHCFEVSAINPGFVLGPLLLKTRNKPLETIINLLGQNDSLIPDIYLPVCDVRDVALAHSRAIKLPEAVYKRHIIVTRKESISLKYIAQVLDKEFVDYDVPTRVAPDIFIKFFSLFDKSLRLVTPVLGHKAYFDNRRMHNILSIEPHHLKKTIIDTGFSLIEKKMVPEPE